LNVAPRISIAMTTFNGAQFLPAQLESIAAQSRQPDELIVCDDASTDATIDVLENFARSMPFEMRIVRNRKNIGHERNFAQAVDLCGGDIIFLADQDDAWYPERLAAVEQAFSADPAALLVVNDVLIADGDLVPLGRTVMGQMRAAGVLGPNAKGLTLGCATAFRSRLRRLISPIPPLEYGHDSWIHDFTEVLGRRRVLPQVLQLYRRHGENASTWAFNDSRRASPLVMMRPSAGKDLSPEYTKRARALSLMLERVRSVGPEGFRELGAGTGYDRIIVDLERAIAAVQRRRDIFRHGWLARKWVAIRLLARGDYNYFLGWRSFVKDLIR
jgi:glycosyltransferase involved in cell wall biosynthesis